jgi:hypothetical protein
VYWRYWKWPNQPSLYDIFLDEDHVIVVLSFRFSYFANGHAHLERMKTAKEYSKAQWTMVRADGSIVNSTFSKSDPEMHSRVLVFPYDSDLRPYQVTIVSKGPDIEYENVRFCALPPRVQKFGAVCTQNFVTNKEQVLDWVGWHRAHGFDQAILYVNEEDGMLRMEKSLSKAIDNGSLVLVDWGWPSAYRFHDQPVTQMSCLWRAKGRFKWLGINDLDEIFLPGNPEMVADVLNRYESMGDQIGSIACCNRWLSGGNRVSELRECARDCEKPPHRQKNVVRVDNVDYFCNHRIMLGLPEQRSNGSELVNGHWGGIKDVVHMEPCGLVAHFKPVVEEWIKELS